jgi:hypothetical protein
MSVLAAYALNPTSVCRTCSAPDVAMISRYRASDGDHRHDHHQHVEQIAYGATFSVVRDGRRYHFARYANAATTRVWVPVDSVGSMAGAKNSE